MNMYILATISESMRKMAVKFPQKLNLIKIKNYWYLKRKSERNVQKRESIERNKEVKNLLYWSLDVSFISTIHE